MTEGYTWRDHLEAAHTHLCRAQTFGLAGRLPDVLEELTACRASATRAIILLPKPDDPEAA